MFKNCDTLYSFIKQFDIEMSKDPDNIQLRILFAKIIVEIGQLIQRSESGLTKGQELTFISAKEFIIKNSDENWDSFCINSTNSYPFGPGDGCYSVEETRVPGCNPGSGCISGIGSLAFMGLPEIIWKIVMEKLPVE